MIYRRAYLAGESQTKKKSTLTFTTAVSVIRLFPALLKFLANKVGKFIHKTFFHVRLLIGSFARVLPL